MAEIYKNGYSADYFHLTCIDDNQLVCGLVKKIMRKI